MIFDLHIHTGPGSHDSCIAYHELVTWAARAKLDGICITEHGFKKTGVADRLSKQYNFIILEGIEVSTDLGDILVYGVDAVPAKLRGAEELRQFVTNEGGIMFAAHPFREEVTQRIDSGLMPNISLESALHLPILELTDGLEAANGWSAPEDVAFCGVVCERAGLRAIGGSDAHFSHQIGSCVTVFENPVCCETDLLAELRRGACHAEDRRNKEQKKPNWWLTKS